MPKKPKSQKFTFQSFIRLIIFSVIVFFSITWLNSQKQLKSSLSDPTVVLGEQTENTFLSDLYQKIPVDSRHQIENFNETKIGIFFQDTSKYIEQQLNGFPGKQIKEIQKDVVKNVSDGIIKNIDKN
jgi:hypothetical protein